MLGNLHTSPVWFSQHSAAFDWSVQFVGAGVKAVSWTLSQTQSTCKGGSQEVDQPQDFDVDEITYKSIC